MNLVKWIFVLSTLGAVNISHAQTSFSSVSSLPQTMSSSNAATFEFGNVTISAGSTVMLNYTVSANSNPGGGRNTDKMFCVLSNGQVSDSSDASIIASAGSGYRYLDVQSYSRNVSACLAGRTLTAGTPAICNGTASSTSCTTWGGTTSATISAMSITVTPPASTPTVSAVSPSTGPTEGGTTITIAGTDLTGATAVTVGGNSCLNLTANTATSITCTTLPGTAGNASVLVTTPAGTSAANTLFAYVVPTPAAIPTLGEWAMIFMASLMAMFGIRRMRRIK
jgi:hypothetical protein